MKVTIVLGSVRKGRQSGKVALYLEKLLKDQSVDTDLIDLAEQPLPILEDKTGISLGVEALVTDVSQRLASADAILLVTPEYHGSFSGALKNALDYFWAEFQKKPVGVVAVSAGRMGGINASIQLQHVVLSLGAYALPLKLLVPEVQNVFGASADVPQENFSNSAKKFLTEFLWLTEAVAAKKENETKVLENV